MPFPFIDTGDDMTVRLQFRAWIDGAIERIRGTPLHDNPHRERSAEGDAWENAWEMIDMEITATKMIDRELKAAQRNSK